MFIHWLDSLARLHLLYQSWKRIHWGKFSQNRCDQRIFGGKIW